MNDYTKEDDRTPEQVLVHELRHATQHLGGSVVGVMLDALGEALSEDMEQGAAWMNDAAHAEFKRKYPRFTTLFSVARNIDWSKES
jgi:hypothetical protein